MGVSGAPLAVARPASVRRCLPILRAGLPMTDAVGEQEPEGHERPAEDEDEEGLPVEAVLSVPQA